MAAISLMPISENNIFSVCVFCNVLKIEKNHVSMLVFEAHSSNDGMNESHQVETKLNG